MPAFEPNPRQDPTLVTGVRGPEDALTERTVVDMRDKIEMYMPEAPPFLTLSGKVKGKRTVHNLKYDWMEKDSKPRKVIVSGAQTDIDVTVEVGAPDADKLADNDVFA